VAGKEGRGRLVFHLDATILLALKSDKIRKASKPFLSNNESDRIRGISKLSSLHPFPNYLSTAFDSEEAKQRTISP
ncbi:hypothetical protein HAX54_021250, partial [Datura stramonium]|nr:hypothetical protein [Datura stramonium]